MPSHSDDSADSPYRPFALLVIALLGALVVVSSGKLLFPSASKLYGRLCGRRHLAPHMLGALLVLFVVILWTASSIAVQHVVFETAHFRKPFFITYLSTVTLVVYLPFYPSRVARLVSALRGRPAAYELVREGGSTSRPGDDSLRAPPLGPIAELALASRVGLLFFASQLCFIIGLELSTVSSVTVIAASSSLWTLLFSALRLREHVSALKLAATLLSFVGVLIVVRYGGGVSHHAATAPHGTAVHGGGVMHGGGGHGHGRTLASQGDGSLVGHGVTLLSAVLYGG